MFEDLLIGSLSNEVSAYVEAAVRQAKADRVAKFRDVHLAKAMIRTYMAWQDPPDVQYLGLAIKRGVFEQIESKCTLFIEWLERLFGPLKA